MNILDLMNIETETNMGDLDVTTVNVIDNDLLYILSVLEKLDDVVGKTYGPFSGYVANEHRIANNASIINYTKDGMTTLSTLNTLVPTDLIIANAVTKLTTEIKEKSGDGSTTAVKLLYQLIKQAAYAIRNNVPDIYQYRINTPKVIHMILDKIKSFIESTKIKTVTYEDLRAVGYISLNNDEDLCKPLDELIEYMKAENIEIDENFELHSTPSETDETRLISRPGYRLSAQSFLINEDRLTMNNVKLIFIPYILDLKMQIPLEEIHKFAQSHSFKNSKGEPLQLLFVVSELDPSLVEFYKNKASTAWADGKMKLNYDFIQLDTLSPFLNNKRKDLCALLNTQELYLMDHIELRHEIPTLIDENGNTVKGDKFDNATNTSLWKMKMYTEEIVVGKDEEGNDITALKRDHQTSRQNFFKALSTLIINGLEVDVYKAGGDDSLSVAVTAGQETSPKLEAHIEELKELVKSDDHKTSRDADIRLSNLNSKYYVIEVASKNVDKGRLGAAYRDATMAINSSIKYGYHMGGSMGIYLAILKVQNEITFALKDLETVLLTNDREHNRKVQQDDIKYRTALFLLSKLKDSYALLIRELVPGRLTPKEAILNGYIDLENFYFGNTRVISPVETDIETIRGTLALFSSFFSSLAIEFIDANSALHAKNVSRNVEMKLDEREGKKKPESVSKTSSTSATESSTEEVPVEELSEEEKLIKEQFEEKQKEYREMMSRRLLVGMAPNVRPLEDMTQPRHSNRDAVDRVIEKYGPKQISDKITISGYNGDIKDIGSKIEEQRREEERKKREINLSLQRRMGLRSN